MLQSLFISGAPAVISEYVRLFSTGETGRETHIVKSRGK